jgi:hypothetical protein
MLQQLTGVRKNEKKKHYCVSGESKALLIYKNGNRENEKRR